MMAVNDVTAEYTKALLVAKPAACLTEGKKAP